MNIRNNLIAASLVLALAAFACSSGPSQELLDLELKLQTLETQLEILKTEITLLKENVGDEAAEQILSEWSREVPQSTRVENNYQALRTSVFDAEQGAAAQLNRALVRTANVAALTVIRSDLAFSIDEARRLEILNQCMEFLMGITSSTRSCNLEPISPGQ